jgi:PTH1 family peptidyl-tRNA hydrolase
MQIIAGLGNPGAKYANNRHNVGFMAADAIARRHSFAPWSRKFQAEIATGDDRRREGPPDQAADLHEPLGPVRRRGNALLQADARRHHRASTTRLDLTPGKLRIKVGGGAGGHNGIRSLDQHIAQSYRRVRIGVGHPGVKELVHSHVLGDFAKADRDWLDPLLAAIADNADLLVKHDDSGLMNKIAVALGGGSKGGASGTGGSPGGGADNGKPVKKAQSHIRQARPNQPDIKLPESGPMAAMLKKLFGKD